MHGMSGDEKRIRKLEELVLRQQKRLDSTKKQLDQVSQDQARDQSSDGLGGGGLFVRAQAVGAIGASSTNTLGTGTARLLRVVAGARFKLRPSPSADTTVSVVNDTGGAIPDKTYLILAIVDGLWTVIVGDCATTTPADAPDPTP